MHAHTIFRFIVLVALALGGLATSSASADYTVIRNSGNIGRFVEGTDGSQHFQGIEDTTSPVDPLCGSTIETQGFKGQIVCGTGGEKHLRGVEGDYVSQDNAAYPGGESVPVAPNACQDTLGRQRLSPCRGN